MVWTILVTGATGNIGSELLKQLSSISDGNIRVRAAVRSINGASKIKDQEVQLVELDYNKPASIDKALDNIDKMFLLTPTDPNLVEFTSNLVKAAKNTTAGKVKHIVKLSHIRADAKPQIQITRLHRQAEKVIEESGIPFTFLRPNFFMQNFLYYGQTENNQTSFYLPVEDGKVSFVDVRDIASVATKALTEKSEQHLGKAYDITGPQSLTYPQAIELLSKETGKKMSYTHISDEAARQGMKARGMADWHIPYVMELFNITTAGYLSDIYSSVEDVTGKKPISFSQFAKDYAPSFE